MKSFEALDAFKYCYLVETTLTTLEQYPFLEISQSILKLLLLRAKKDFQHGLPISESRYLNLMKLVALKNTMATSTVSVERSFSTMSGVCNKIKSRITASRLGDMLCITLKTWSRSWTLTL
mgnify:CR=1 FL=1